MGGAGIVKKALGRDLGHLGAVLELSWGHLGVVLGHLRSNLSRYGPISSHLGSILGHVGLLGTQKQSNNKNIGFLMVFNDF